jgi:hypothetical protein
VSRSIFLAVLFVTVTGCAVAPRASDSRSTETAAASPCMATASRIPSKDCAPGRSYSREDIARTGAPTTADALQMLDPSITVGH